MAILSRFSLEGRTAMITGASGTLGGRFAHVLAEAGASVVLAARRVEAMQALIPDLPHPDRHRALSMDVTDTGSVAAVFETFGSAALPDILINNSGIANTAPALDETDADWSRVIDVNLNGARHVSVAFARNLVDASKPGAIINIASVLGFRQGGAVTSYAASKAALVQLTKQHALEWARHGIRVNALAPGYIETDINRDFFATKAGQTMIKRIPMGRLGQPDELDGAVLLLASDAGSFMTGSVITADGGHLVSSL
jgi:NAD(P)-dependent dehydrogenase (short-subunit alcohol dehydrogenase family)